MAGRGRKFYIDSPVFTDEYEERYHYVDTEVDGLTAEEDVELDKLMGDAVKPQVSVSHDQHRFGTQTDQQNVRSSMLRDSLEDYSDSDAAGKNNNSTVVASPSRYEDLAIGDEQQHSVQQQASRKTKRVNFEPDEYYLHDNAEEYEEAQIERQNQRLKARRAHVPHLELSHSDDEPSNGEVVLELEFNDGRSIPGNDYQKHAGHDNFHCVNFAFLPHNTKSHNGSQLIDSLEVSEYHPGNGDIGENPDYERSLFTEGQAHGKIQRHNAHSTNPLLSVYKSAQTGQHSHFYDGPVQYESYQAPTLKQSFTAKRQQLSSHLPPYSAQAQVASDSQGQSSQTTSSTRSRSDESSRGIDFIEANRHNVNRRPQRSYGQIHSRKKGKENAADFELSSQDRPVDSASSVSSVRHEKRNPGKIASDRNTLPANTYNQECSVVGAEQLWQARSQSLAARKESAESLPEKNRRGKPGKLTVLQKKVTRDVCANDAYPVIHLTTSSSPCKHSSGIQQMSSSSFTVPVQAAIPENPTQKVSVDINLNVVSPRPLLNQPSTSLPIHHTVSPPEDVYQLSSRKQTLTNSTQPYYQATSNIWQPSTVVSQPISDSAFQYTSGMVLPPSYAASSSLNSAPQFVFSGRQHQHPVSHFNDSQGCLIPNQTAPQHLPIRYNYNYPHTLALPVTDAPQHCVHPYQMQPAEHYAAMNRGIARENSVPAMVSQSMSSYNVLPPVGSSRKEMLKPHSAPQVGIDTSSYAEQYRRQKKKPDYKPYTIDEFRKLKNEMKVKLGTLGPDLENDAHRERREKAQRKQEYARSVQERNRADLQQAKPKAKEPSSEEQLDRRRLAIEYAKKVPKPKVLPRRNSVEDASSEYARPSLASFANDGDLMLDEVQRLEERHRLEKQKVTQLFQNNI